MLRFMLCRVSRGLCGFLELEERRIGLTHVYPLCDCLARLKFDSGQQGKNGEDIKEIDLQHRPALILGSCRIADIS